MKKIVAIVLALGASPAFAQDQKFVPFTISKEVFNGMQAFLQDVPARYANPLISTLNNLEQKALADSQMTDEQKAEAEKLKRPPEDKK